MAVKLLFPADRAAFQYGGLGEPIRTPQITALVIYVDQATTTLADIYVPGNGRIVNSTIYTDEAGLVPEFLGPLGVTRLWAVAQVDGQSATPYPLDAAFGPRIDTLAASIPIPGDTTGGTANTIRSGDGAPSGTLGIDGDWYIDKTALAIYGPKTAGLWGPATSLVGPAGPAGPAGSGSGGAGSYTHSQFASANIWDITHPLAFIPNVMVLDSAGTEVTGDVRVLTPSRIQVEFSVPFSGTALLS